MLATRLPTRRGLTEFSLDAKPEPSLGLAERKGFEPLEAFRLQRFSRPPP